jgi:nucleoside-diphosphate-sugar epimerase
MRILLVGGSGGVGTAITPYLRARHEVCVLDVRPPKDTELNYIEGSITDPEALSRGLEGCDTFINLVMHHPGPTGGDGPEQDVASIQQQYAVNTLGLHLLLFLAQARGVRFGVHTSTMTVHDRSRRYYPQEELLPRDSKGLYGLTKGMGEQICEYFARVFDMNLIALRITGPRSREQYLAERRARPADYDDSFHVTDEEDLADAYLAALNVVSEGHGRFEAVFIAGDENGRTHNLTKAERLLGWHPRSQALTVEGGTR